MSSPLKTEILSGPLAAQIAPLVSPRSLENDAAISELLRAKTTQAPALLTAHDILQMFSLWSLRVPIIDSTAPTCKEFTQAMADFPVFDFRIPAVLAKITAVLEGLVNEPLIPNFTEDEKSTILAMGYTQVSREDQLGIGCSPYAVSQALDWD